MENLYLIKLSDENESFYKIGTTVHKYCRFYEIMKHGYDVEIIYMLFNLEFYKALEAESYLQSIFQSYTPLKKFGGYTECFLHININTYKSEIHKIFDSYSKNIENLPITWR